MMAVGLLLNLLILVLFIFVVKKIFSRGKSQGSKGGEIRRFFHYSLLFALVVVSSIGTTGLIGRWLHIGDSIFTDRGNLALESSFTVIGLPLLALIVRWTKTTFRKDPNENQSLGWNLYLTAISITALILNLDAQMNLYGVVIGENTLQGKHISQFFIWGGVWLIHFRMHNRLSRSENTIGEHLIGSLIGLAFSFIGLINLLQALIRLLFGFESDPLIVSQNNQIESGLVTLLVGAPVWFIYWIREAARASRESIWYAYVLLIGVGGGLLTTVISSSISLYSVLVWFFGDIDSLSAREHFKNAPTSIAFIFVGLIIGWYHRDVLQSTQSQARTEIRRIYEYVISGIGLLAASAGFTMILVSIIQSFAKSEQITSSGSTNALLVAITLLIVGSPMWWFMWHVIGNQVEINPGAEQAALVRRVYLLVLLGASTVASIISLVVATYIAFYDLFKGEIGLLTIRSDRFAIGVLITALFVALFHWNIFKNERHVEIVRDVEKIAPEKVIFFVELKLKPRSSTKFLDEFNRYARKVRKEDGCEQLDILLDPKSKNTVCLYEIWSNRQSHQNHLNSQGFAQWKEFSDPLVTELTVKTLNPA